jgi:DNA polymerase III subunit delta'
MTNSALDPVEKLSERLAEGNLHHALIFQGNDLEETERKALELTREILGMPDERTQHPDLFHLRPSGKMRIISVEKTRNLIGELNRSSNQGGAKVALLHESDRMKKEASNAFLKTLEEPPPETYLFLLTIRPYSILPTIRSRCMQVRVSASQANTTDEEWENWTDKYREWINLLLDRKKLMSDRTTPVFAAYGLAETLVSIIKRRSDEECRSRLKELSQYVDDKEKDALDASIRKGVRARFLRKLSGKTRELGFLEQTHAMDKNGIKLARVISNLEKNVGLMEVNLKEEVALEDFWLSSLRIWSSK